MKDRTRSIAATCCAALTAMICSAASAQVACEAIWPKAPKPMSPVSLLALLEAVPEGSTWVALPADVRTTLQRAADARLAWFRATWSRPALSRKEAILLDCPTSAMSRAMDRYLGEEVAGTGSFSLANVKDAALRRALVRLYLSNFAAHRADLTYPIVALPNLDWDGETGFDSFPLPDATAYSDIRAHAAELVQDLEAIAERSLAVAERPWRQAALFSARRIRSGGFIAARGGQDWLLPCQFSGAGNMVASAYGTDKGTPTLYRDDEEAIAEFNAIYLHNTSLKWLDQGTLPAARSNALCSSNIEETIDQHVVPRSAQAGRAMRMLRGWWFERASVTLPTSTFYSDADRSELWEAFTAEQQASNDGTTSMTTYAAQVDAFRRQKIDTYREVARSAVELVFPDESVLSASQKSAVLAAIAAEEAFGQIKHAISQILDRAQGTSNGSAATAWQAVLAKHVQVLGGVQPNGGLYPEHLNRAETMFAEVQAWLVKRYPNYPQPIDAALAKVKINYTARGDATTDPFGRIDFGLGTPRSLLEYYSLMLHELRHAVRAAATSTAPDPSKVAKDDGVAVEGSGVAAEDMLRVKLLRDVMPEPLSVLLYQLDFAIRDARVIATTQATLGRYRRERCDASPCTSTTDAARAIAARFGLTGTLAETLVTRSHLGTQYLQYIFAGEQMKAELTTLSRAVRATERQIDPFMLFGCGLNTPQRDATYVGKLKACLAAADRP